MIISQIIGGLGNQMFQYAAGRSLALRKGEDLKLDLSGFANYGLHQGFELARVFTCDAQAADATDIRTILKWQSPALVRRLLRRQNMQSFRRPNFVVEPYFSYWAGINDAPAACYLSGYWQSEKYFSNHAAQIRRDFRFGPAISDENEKVAEQIAASNAVSLHIRRGDYLKNPTNLAIYGTCSLAYYQAAMRHIAERVSDPHFIVFSDDLIWAREQLKSGFRTSYVDHNRGAESFNDMLLMSLCQHHIIANSTFSWWGAWLGSNPAKIVAAPDPWFDDQSIDSSDLIPDSWHTLPKYDVCHEQN